MCSSDLLGRKMRRTLFLFWSWIRGSALFHPVRFLRDFRRFFLDWSKFNAENGRKSFHVGWRNLYPCWEDWNASACTLSYYFWQDLWAARKIFMARPPVHFDIASRVDGFIAHLLCFMPVTMLDIRPLPWQIKGLDFIRDRKSTRLNSSHVTISYAVFCLKKKKKKK